jgi:midasin
MSIFHFDGVEYFQGRFEWLDGPLIKALEQGHWVLLDQANLANASVLDRLNPLLETDGVLLINECGIQGSNGQVRIVRPHPNFRLFLSIDPHYGEVSRAMRNRCVEINLLPSTGVDPRSPMYSLPANSLLTQHDLLTLLCNTTGLSGRRLPHLLLNVHTQLSDLASSALRFGVSSLTAITSRRLLQWSALAAEQLRRYVPI